MRDAGFDQVTVTVKLVLDLQVSPARPGEMDLVVGEEVTIRLLGGCQQVDQAVHELPQAGVGVLRPDAGGGVQPFVSVRIGEEPALAAAGRFPGSQAKILDAARRLKLLPLVEDSPPGVDLQALMPEITLDSRALHLASGCG